MEPVTIYAFDEAPYFETTVISSKCLLSISIEILGAWYPFIEVQIQVPDCPDIRKVGPFITGGSGGTVGKIMD